MAKLDHPVMLIVLDGWGHSEDTRCNAIHAARKPAWDRMWSEFPHSLIRCSGGDVGLPDEQMGNSEVGHVHLGAGRLVNQELTRISKAIAAGEFFHNPILRPAFERAAARGRAVHLLGLLSPGGVHSHELHTVAMLELAARCGVRQVYVHAFLDGRDMPPKSAAASLQLITQKCQEFGVGRIASIIGRYFAMDRNKSWDRVKLAYDLIVDGQALYQASDPMIALEEAYARGETDEFVKATAVHGQSMAPARVEDGDVVVFGNFRADRARELTTAFIAEEFPHFTRSRVPKLDAFIAMTDYSEKFKIPVAFPTTELKNTFGDIVARHGLHQLRIAETEKYAHVTFFFNGGEEKPFAHEDRILVPSPNVPTYDLRPEMSAVEVTDKLVEAIRSRQYDAIICNYANADMVGHTGNFEATVQCIEALDRCLGRVLEACREVGMEFLITADHGNAEKMCSAGHPHTAHTSNLVPLLYIGRPAELVSNGCLSDIAPTMLSLMGLEQPREMTGRTLVKLFDRAQNVA